jgi:hypothetical protein
MMVVEEIRFTPGQREAVRNAPFAPPGERAARRSLRDQIARMERDLGECLVTAFPAHERVDVGMAPPTVGPRILSLGDLETARDDLAARLPAARDQVARRGEIQERNRVLLEKMRIDPKRHKFVRIPREDLGIPGCGAYEVRPRMGIVGMFMGWWQVKLSSGCPLGVPPRPRGRGGGPPGRLIT